ncbi:MAG: hypothetical protein NTV22_07480 [bacterium]|nr:hypothetical protein [bacterium]
MALSLALISYFLPPYVYTLAQWDIGSVALVVAHTLQRTAARPYDAYFLGSSQIAQVHPGMLSNQTGKSVFVSCIPGGDISYMLAMSRAIADRSAAPPLIVAEFSRYVASDIESYVYRDALEFIPGQYWARAELPAAIHSPLYRNYYGQGMLNSLLPFVRYRESIKALAITTTPVLATCILSDPSRPKVVRCNRISDDGHGGPYPHLPPPYQPCPTQVRPALSADKEHCWRQLLALHRQGVIRLVLFIPPFHSSWRPYYDMLYHGTNSPVAALLREFCAAGVPQLDCSMITMTDDDCMDAHHFSLSGMTKLAQYVATNLNMRAGGATPAPAAAPHAGSVP